MKYNRKMAICEKIKYLRIKNGFSQEDIAIQLNIEQNTFSRLERGETKIDIERLYQLAELYNVTIHLILDGLPTSKID